MRTRGLRERSITHWGQLVGARGGTAGWWGSWGGIKWGEMPDIGDGGMEAANHIAMYAPMKQSCILCTCTPEPKVL